MADFKILPTDFGPVAVPADVEPYVEALGVNRIVEMLENLYAQGANSFGTLRLVRYPTYEHDGPGAKQTGWRVDIAIPYNGESRIRVAEEKLL